MVFEAEGVPMAAETGTAFVPPYISFTQLTNVLDRMKAEGAPSRVDRSYLGSWSGSAQAQFLKASRSLGLIDELGRPTQVLKDLVSEEEKRPAVMRAILEDKYPGPLALGKNATQQQLDESFRQYEGISGSTTRKAITFFLHAAKFAGIELSPFFKAGRLSTGGGTTPRSSTRRRSRDQTGTNSEGEAMRPSPPAPTDPLASLHPAIVTLVKALPSFGDDGAKPEFPAVDREAWFAYARATFNLIYALPEGDAGGADMRS